MRKFMKIIESITNDFATNQQIENTLSHLPADMQQPVLDGLELVFNSHTTGLSISEWLRSMNQLGLGDTSEEDHRKALALMIESFPTLVKRDGDTLRWNDAPIHTDGDLDMSDPTAQLAQAQIEYTAQILELMKQHGQFSARDIMTSFAAMSGLPPHMVEMLVNHIIETNSSSIRSVGPGRYELASPERPKTPSENMAFWRDLAARGVQNNPDV